MRRPRLEDPVVAHDLADVPFGFADGRVAGFRGGHDDTGGDLIDLARGEEVAGFV